MNRLPGRGALLLAAILMLASCGDDSPASPTPVVTSPSTTTTSTTLPTPTTTEGGSLVSGRWVLHTIDGVFTDTGTRVWPTETIPGTSSIARDQEGGVVWGDGEGLWWLSRGTSQPVLVLARSDIEGIYGVVSTNDGPVVRIRASGRYDFVALSRGAAVGDPGGWSLDLETGAWTVGSISVRIVGPEVLWDQEGQPAEIVEPAHLVVTDGGVEMVNLRVGGVYQAWARIDDFDGRRVVVSRYVHEPALPTETFFVIDLGCAECIRTFSAAATRVALADERGTPMDRPLAGEVQPPTWGFSPATLLLTDQGVRRLGDGHYLARIDTLAADGRSLEADLMVWFSGEEANIAARVDGEYEPVPNDYYIRNEDPTLLRLRIDPEVTITSAWWGSDGGNDLMQKPMTLDELVGAFTGTPDDYVVNLIYDPWWITIRGGVVVALDEQYVP